MEKIRDITTKLSYKFVQDDEHIKAEIAQHAHMSKYYMCRKFKQDTGTTIGHYIKHQRIYLAQKLLNETTKPIAVIALDCGFNDISHFTKAFKAFVKVTPSEYRRRKNQG